MIVNIMRHTAVLVTPGLCYGQSDVPLRESFPEEAQRAKENLIGVEFDAVYTSPLSRCIRLAKYCGFAEAIVDNRLKEMNFGLWENTLIYENTSEEVQRWFADQIHIRPPKGECFDDVKQRLLDFLIEKKSEGHNAILLFAHGGIVLSAQLLQGKQFSGDLFAHLPPYGSLNTFEF